MSAGNTELDLKLNLSPPSSRGNSSESEASSSNSSSEMSVQGSCVSSEPEQESMQYESDIEPRSMVLVGCPRCLMYVLLSEVDPKCPRCKSTVLLDFLNEEGTNKKTNN